MKPVTTCRTLVLIVVLLLPGVGGGGCDFAKPDIATVPDNPTFATDIKPILDDHCNLCHGAKPNRGARSRFRLDSYEDKDGRRGAASMAQRVLDSVDRDEMPPAAAWGDGVGPNAKQAIRLWVEHGSPP
jgi:hypothetical protein